MVLELKQLFEIAGEVQTFKYELDLSGYELFSLHPFCSPVHVTGRVFNTAGVVELDYSVQFSMKLPCDRCMDEFQSDYAFSFRNTLVAQTPPIVTSISKSRISVWIWTSSPFRTSCFIYHQSSCAARTARAFARSAAQTGTVPPVNVAKKR